MRQFSLDMIPGGAQTAVSCNQYEAGDTWVFALYYDGGRYSIPQDAAVSITGTKPDGAAYNIAGTVVDNAVVIEVTEQMTACAGRSIAEILVESEADGTTLYSANFPLLVEPAAVHGELSPSVIPTAIVDENGNVYYEGKSIMGLYPVESASGDVAVIHDGAEDLPVRDLSAAIEPVQAGSGDPSPSNVRAISGWDAVKVMRTGANLMPPANVKGAVTYSGITYEELGDGRYRIYGTSTKADYATYTLSKSFFIPKGDGSTYLLLNNSNQNSGVKIAFVNGSTIIDTFSCNTPYRQTNAYSVLSEKEITGFRLAVDNGTTCDIIVAPMFVPADEYENHSIDLPTTVYGGTLDVTTGILTVTKGLIASYAGETLPGAWISDRDVYAAGATPTTGAQVVYDLASHQTYTLTPVQVKTLLGENRIYADAGRVTVQYRADFNAAGLMFIPKAPTADGTYRLAVDVTGGTPTYRWEAAE